MGSGYDTKHYDVICLGSGEAGKILAWTLSPQGTHCAVIENKWLGGSCPNVACLPSKSIIHSAKVIHYHKQAKSFGFDDQDAGFDIHAVGQRKKDMVEGLMQTHRVNFENSGAEVLWGEGRFVGPKTIQIRKEDGSESIVEADNFVINTGSRAAIDDVPGLKEANPLTHVEMFDIGNVPEHLIIIGAGYVGLEFAQAVTRFGAKVTVVDRHPRILKREDEDVATLLQSTLEKESVTFLTNTSINRVSGKVGDSLTLTCNKSGEPIEIQGSHILCATGRLPNTQDIGAHLAGVKLTDDGYIAVDEHNRTNVDGVFAVGDCTGPPYFTHIGYDDFRIVRDLLTGREKQASSRSTRQIPFTLFTDPEFAHVGLRVHEAKAKDIQYRLTKLPMAFFLRTRTLGETEGFAKALISAEDDTILGFSAVGAGVGDLLPVVQLAMKKGLPYTDIADLVITHPTLSEGLVALFSAVPARK